MAFTKSDLRIIRAMEYNPNHGMGGLFATTATANLKNYKRDALKSELNQHISNLQGAKGNPSQMDTHLQKINDVKHRMAALDKAQTLRQVMKVKTR